MGVRVIYGRAGTRQRCYLFRVSERPLVLVDDRESGAHVKLVRLADLQLWNVAYADPSLRDKGLWAQEGPRVAHICDFGTTGVSVCGVLLTAQAD